jgi:biotin carboxyl carrier protein
MSIKKLPEKRIPRVAAADVHPIVGEAAEKLKAVVPVFGEKLVNAVLAAINTEQVRHGELELTSLTDPKQKIKVAFDNVLGSKDISVRLTGDWQQVADVTLDNPLFSPVKGIVYRKRQPTDEKAIAEEGQVIEPGGAICAISQTKNNIWYLQLSLDKFPKGGVLTKFVVPNGKEVEKNGTICYIKKIE